MLHLSIIAFGGFTLHYYKRTITWFLLIFLIIFQTTLYVYAQPQDNELKVEPIDIPTPCAILIDAKTGNILFEKNSNQQMFPASITKIMTAILALEKSSLESKVIMSKNAVYDLEPNSSNAGFLVNEEFTLEQLLYAMMLWSANESANAIAESISGSIDEFAKLMTQRAKELGATNTNFVNSNGLHNPEHYTSAYDMAMITKHAMSIPKFREIVSTTCYILPPTNKMPKEKELYNRNQLLLTTSKYYYPCAIGVKTGYTTNAGSTLVSAAQKDGIELIAVVLNSPLEAQKSYTYIDSIKLFDHGFTSFTQHKVANKNQIIDTVRANNSKEKIIGVMEEDTYVLLPNGTNPNNVKSIKQINPLQAPVKKGDIIGHIYFKEGSKDLGKFNIIAYNDAPLSSNLINGAKIKSILKIIWLIIKWILIVAVCLIILFIIFAIFYNKIRMAKRKKIKNSHKNK